MATTTFTDKSTIIEAEWCNEVDALVHDIFNASTTDAGARTALDVYSTSEVYALDSPSDLKTKALTGLQRLIAVGAGFNSVGAINIIGDSITHGAFAGNLYLNGWARILARMVNADNNTNSYGYTPYISLGSGPTLSTDVHTVAFTGTWVDSGNGGDLLSGLALRNALVGSKITFTVPFFQNRCKIWYVKQPGGGTFTVTVNGVLATTVDTNAAVDNFANVEVSLSGNDYGEVSIVVENTVAGNVDFAGISYLSNVGAGEATVNNFSQSGRTLAAVNEAVIQHLAENSSVLIMALGHNDVAGAAFTQRIDWLISYCNLHKVKLYVPDFRWSAAPSDAVRLELKRLADSVAGATYIPFPDYLNVDGSAADSTHLITTLGMWEDVSHPNALGNQWIAEVMAKAMDLSCTSKREALEYHDYWYPLKLDPAALVENSLPSSVSTVSSFKRSGSVLKIKLYLQHAAAGAFPAGNYVIQTAWPAKSGFSGVLQGTVAPGYIRTDTGVHTSFVEITAAGSVTLHVTDGTWTNDQIIEATMSVL